MLILNELSHGLYLATLFSAVPLFSSLFVGLIVSVFQAATQIQESTLSFVPKLVAVSLSLYFLSPWIVSQLVDYTTKIIESLVLI